MTLFLFVHKDASRKGTALQKILNQHFHGHDIQVFQTFNALKHKLKEPAVYDREVYVLFAESNRRLQELCSLMDLLDDKRIVLILPDDAKATISMALQFYPRFFTYINTAYDDLCAVINKMMNQT